MHAKTDSDVTSVTQSSPPRSPKRAAYYVQSPSHDGVGVLTNASFQSTPLISPMGSPPHSNSSVGHHSRESSSTRFSGSMKPGGGSRKISPNDVASLNKNNRNNKIDMIEEEGLVDSHKSLPRRCYFFIFVLGFLVLFSLFSLILLVASKPQKPNISVKSIKLENFVIQAGSDGTGVATDMVTMNSTVKLTFRNTATFFGLHVSSTPFHLSYSEIVLATGSTKKFYQSRKSQRSVSVSLIGDKIPLYGSGASLSSNSTGAPSEPVPLKLKFVVRSRAYVLGKLVQPKFNKRIECSVVYDPKKHNVGPMLLKNSCTYH